MDSLNLLVVNDLLLLLLWLVMVRLIDLQAFVEQYFAKWVKLFLNENNYG